MRVDGGRLFPRLLPGNEAKKDFFAAAKIIFRNDLIRTGSGFVRRIIVCRWLIFLPPRGTDWRTTAEFIADWLAGGAGATSTPATAPGKVIAFPGRTAHQTQFEKYIFYLQN